jgi:hypothetical protein
MGFLDRIFKRCVPATPEQIGEALYVAAIKTGENLAGSLVKTALQANTATASKPVNVTSRCSSL